jgi:hypothetical protein
MLFYTKLRKMSKEPPESEKREFEQAPGNSSFIHKYTNEEFATDFQIEEKQRAQCVGQSDDP